MKQRKAIPSQPESSKTLLWLMAISLWVFSSCELERNPLEVAYQDIQQIVMQSEKRSESLNWNFDVQNEQFHIEQNGLDALYIPEAMGADLNLHGSKSLRYLIDLAVTNSEKESPSYLSYLISYETSQTNTVLLAQELQQTTLDSFKRYKNNLLNRLNGGSLTQIQYDELLTKSKETFTIYLRHKYQESRIIAGSSFQLNEVLQKLQKALSEKSWERLSSHLKQK